MIVILLIIAIIVFLSVIQPQPSDNKIRQQADSGYFGYSDHSSHHDGFGSDGGFSDSGCGGGGGGD
ncbi:hypothetical protein JS609_03932 [Bacillus subtilis]|uniref:hypothetical protein n=1 Tax=Bacillus TaxID=1386 RepID=UPI0002D3C11C|nr:MULTISPECIES: hypothetical protein [Bacillus]MBU8843829.1 hypothetical protein [Alkalicoccobacillus gibsonii]CJR61416.1 Uncharacterised protein [Streptococcus pneumoniae]AID00179.1 hypothetical protein Q433_21375 [Bacillus subtilis subsp. subtilis str. OH 131.1]AMR45312.1 hypothetical protein KHRBS_01195 [Bacillus subtilis subsp. subtilis]AOA56670.1 uncharacterized protein BSHJ0_04127 [Bacillus subtilis]